MREGLINRTADVAGCETAQKSIEPPSVLDRLRQQKAVLENRLTNVNQAIEALEANPETVRIMDLLGKVDRF